MPIEDYEYHRKHKTYSELERSRFHEMFPVRSILDLRKTYGVLSVHRYGGINIGPNANSTAPAL